MLSAFLVEERAPTIKSLDLKSESFLMDRAPGIHWNIEHDTTQKLSRSYNNSSSGANLTPYSEVIFWGVNSLKVEDLRDELETRKLSKSGRKSELVKRLRNRF